MANNGCYLYILNKYETSTYWTKQPIVTTMVYPNGKYSRISLLGKKMKTCNKL